MPVRGGILICTFGIEAWTFSFAEHILNTNTVTLISKQKTKLQILHKTQKG